MNVISVGFRTTLRFMLLFMFKVNRLATKVPHFCNLNVHGFNCVPFGHRPAAALITISVKDFQTYSQFTKDMNINKDNSYKLLSNVNGVPSARIRFPIYTVGSLLERLAKYFELSILCIAMDWHLF